jgi:hypothetical protein
MAAIFNEWKKRKMIPKHRVVEQGGRRVYYRPEAGGSVRTLSVWSLQSCRDKILEKGRQGGEQAVAQMFADMAKELDARTSDPMLFEWFGECYAQMTKAYEALFPVVSPDATTIEEFGFEGELEEFGVDV